MIWWLIACAITGFVWGISKLSSSQKMIISIVVFIACTFVWDYSDSDSTTEKSVNSTVEQSITDSYVKKSVATCLRRETDYQNIHVLNVNKVDGKEDEVTYRWEAEFKFLGVRCRQSGFVYYYEDGDLKDFKRLNDLNVAE